MATSNFLVRDKVKKGNIEGGRNTDDKRWL